MDPSCQPLLVIIWAMVFCPYFLKKIKFQGGVHPRLHPRQHALEAGQVEQNHNIWWTAAVPVIIYWERRASADGHLSEYCRPSTSQETGLAILLFIYKSPSDPLWLAECYEEQRRLLCEERQEAATRGQCWPGWLCGGWRHSSKCSGSLLCLGGGGFSSNIQKWGQHQQVSTVCCIW